MTGIENVSESVGYPGGDECYVPLHPNRIAESVPIERLARIAQELEHADASETVLALMGVQTLSAFICAESDSCVSLTLTFSLNRD